MDSFSNDVDLGNSTEVVALKRRLYNTAKSKKSYLKRRDEISRRRALVRLQSGHILHPGTIKQSVMDDDDKLLINKIEMTKVGHIFVPQRSPEFLQHYEEKISVESQGFYKLLPEDNTSTSYIYTFEKTKDLSFTLQDGFDLIDFMIGTGGRLMRDTSDVQKKIATKNYRSKLHTMMNIYGTSNLLDIYINPERFLNKIMTSHLAMVSLKSYISLIITLHKNSNDNAISGGVHNGQILKFKTILEGGIKFSKEQELQRLEHEPYYRWEDFKKMVRVIKEHPMHNTVQGLRDQVIISMYVNETVLRDNLGLVKIVTTTKDLKGNFVEALNETNYLDLQTGRMKLNDFKTSKYYKAAHKKEHTVIRISKETLLLIREYIHATEIMNIHPVQYLITKNDGTPYKDGKLSSYITDMFERYTGGAKNVSINDLRHSVATHHKDSDIRIRNMISDRLHHSYAQHSRYERHSNNILRFPILQNNSNYDKIDPYLEENVVVIHSLQNNHKVLLFGKVTQKIDENKYLIKFVNSRVRETEYVLPNTNKVFIM